MTTHRPSIEVLRQIAGRCARCGGRLMREPDEKPRCLMCGRSAAPSRPWERPRRDAILPECDVEACIGYEQ